MHCSNNKTDNNQLILTDANLMDGASVRGYSVISKMIVLMVQMKHDAPKHVISNRTLADGKIRKSVTEWTGYDTKV